MNVLTFDVETTTLNKGNPFTHANRLCYVGIKFNKDYYLFDIEYSDNPYGDKLKQIQELFDKADMIVGMNMKFDLHWLYRYGIQIKQTVLMWDIQLGFFLLRNQEVTYPSLNEISDYFSLGSKGDKIAEYWAQGIDTPDIPRDELEEYLKQDLFLTEAAMLKEQTELKQNNKKYRLFMLQMTDLPILAEMERNGMRYLKEESLKYAEELAGKIDRIYRSLALPDWFNLGSGDHVSAFLYGGTIKERYREKYQVTLKNGTIKDKERWAFRPVVFPKQVEPLPKTELAKGNVWSTDQDTLKRLLKKRVSKEVKNFILAVMDYNLIDKLRGTYAEGLPKQMDLHGDEEYIHGQFNQCTVVTGRLSSSKPNLQNRDRRIDFCFVSRF